MTDSRQQPTTTFGSKGRRGQYRLDTPPPAEHVSFNPGQVGRRYGWVEIIKPDRRYRKGWAMVYVATRCVGCGYEQWAYLANLSRGISKGCPSCSQPTTAPKWVLKRVTAMRARCTNPRDAGWKRYGGRGIQFRFKTVLIGARWIVDNLGLDRTRDIDRIDNNGHYEPGNLRYATRAENSRNQRRSRVTMANAEWALCSPFAYTTTCRYLRKGYPKEAIIGLAYKAVLEKRKNWPAIRANLVRLGYMTS